MEREVLSAILFFAAASSSLLLVNKLAIHLVPMPSFISTLQFATCSLFIHMLKCCGKAEVDRWESAKVRPYLFYIGMFVTTIYCNMKALEHSNVETLIVFRACCPLLVSVMEWAFLGRMLPDARSVLSLVLLVCGAAGYVMSDQAFALNGWNAYTWCTAYLIIISVEMVYGKHIVGPHLGFKSMWGPTLYTNTIAIVPMMSIGLLTHEHTNITTTEWNQSAVGLIALSCIIGIAISFYGWYCRSLVSATCYTVLGVANKMLTVTVNALIWDQHASLAGIISLAVCLFAVTGYSQAPMRESEDSFMGSKNGCPRHVAHGCSSVAMGFVSAVLLILSILGSITFLMAPSSATTPRGAVQSMNNRGSHHLHTGVVSNYTAFAHDGARAAKAIHVGHSSSAKMGAHKLKPK
mmetsp:Transcript_21759/g.35933  ORF Transcript_21759/g.35933 Transcript_21759/m.35933 type:complete len:407 (+) Transcript_21759:217-1437(+)